MRLHYYDYLKDIIVPITAALIGIIPSIFFYLYTKHIHNFFHDIITWPYIGKFLVVYKAGISTIFLSREDIIKYRRNPNVNEYIKSNSYSSFTYVGIWLGDDDNNNDNDDKKIKECLMELLQKKQNIKINLYFRNPSFTKADEEWINNYYNCRNAKKQITRCVDSWKKWKEGMNDPQKENRIKIYLHKCNLTCSFFLFNSNRDNQDSHGKEIVFFDQKLYNCSKSRSISMEIKKSSNPESLWGNILQMYDTIKRNSNNQI